MLEHWSYAEAGRRLPVPKSEDTIRRWATAGLCGVVLETVWFGGSPCVTDAAMTAFHERVTAVKRGLREKRPTDGRRAAAEDRWE